MAASGTNGQFRTPRHIIRMMVELMEPTLKDTICDPAMGSAGFIVESAKYITENYKDELVKKENLEHYKTTMFSGFDTDGYHVENRCDELNASWCRCPQCKISGQSFFK